MAVMPTTSVPADWEARSKITVCVCLPTWRTWTRLYLARLSRYVARSVACRSSSKMPSMLEWPPWSTTTSNRACFFQENIAATGPFEQRLEVTPYRIILHDEQTAIQQQ